VIARMDSYQEKLETVTIHFLRRKDRVTDWERFDIMVHSSGTVAVEIGQLTHYTFHQQLPMVVQMDGFLAELEDATREDAFGSYSIRYEGDCLIEGTPLRSTANLKAFVDSVIDRIDSRFQRQCREIIDADSQRRRPVRDP